MAFFKKVEGEAAVVVANGVYKQVDLYTRDGYVYAAAAGGFVRLMADGSTTHPKMRLEYMTWRDGLGRDPLGRLCSVDTPGARLLEEKVSAKLLGGPA